MAEKIVELFGFPPGDQSQAAKDSRESQLCPYKGGTCSKCIGSKANRIRSGVCTISDKDGLPVIICPMRLYADDYALLRHVARIAFKVAKVDLVDGRKAKLHTPIRGHTLVAVFGKGWGGEIKLPGRRSESKKASGFFVDWILARLDKGKRLVEFAALEVQTMDTIGSYRDEREAILEGRHFSGKSAGPNWENVNKRILPQLIYKGHLLEREELCHSGLFFACPEAVYGKILERLGGELGAYPQKSNSLTFMSARLLPQEKYGATRKLEFVNEKTTTNEQVQIAFSSPTNLPDQGAYERAIRAALGEGLKP